MPPGVRGELRVEGRAQQVRLTHRHRHLHFPALRHHTRRPTTRTCQQHNESHRASAVDAQVHHESVLAHTSSNSSPRLPPPLSHGINVCVLSYPGPGLVRRGLAWPPHSALPAPWPTPAHPHPPDKTRHTPSSRRAQEAVPPKVLPVSRWPARVRPTPTCTTAMAHSCRSPILRCCLESCIAPTVLHCCLQSCIAYRDSCRCSDEDCGRRLATAA
jgi:hypothetical protein